MPTPRTTLSVPLPTYGPLNGTSMATPIVSAAGALTLSVLGSRDGNLFKGQQVGCFVRVLSNQQQKSS